VGLNLELIKIKIAYYVHTHHAKENYNNECFKSRSFAGLLMVGDALERAGYHIDYAGQNTVDQYDLILVSITSDCDWWAYIKERLQWPKGNYKIIVGGAGVLNVRPFLPFTDIFMLGRGEELILPLVRNIENNTVFENPSVIYSDQFDPDSNYMIAQSDNYPFSFKIGRDKDYTETEQGCPNKCFFCGYTWQRRHTTSNFVYRDGLIDLSDKYFTMMDIIKNKPDINKIRTTAMDGFSERLRYMVNKKISNGNLDCFFKMVGNSEKAHQIKLYNLANYPTETQEDWLEFKTILSNADDTNPKRDKQFGLILHTTPFRSMPATPAACWSMQYKNIRGQVSKRLGAKKNSVFFKGNSFFAVESMGTDSLSSVILSNIVWRGTEKDTPNIIKLCNTPKFWRSSATIKQKTLEKYFDVDTLFGEFTPDELPTKYLQTYTKIKFKKV